MVAGLTYVQRNNKANDDERKRLAARLHRIADEGRDANSMWEALKEEGQEDLIEGVLEQRDIDFAVQMALSKGGWQAVQRLMYQLPDTCQEKILYLDRSGQLIVWGATDMASAIHEAANDL